MVSSKSLQVNHGISNQLTNIDLLEHVYMYMMSRTYPIDRHILGDSRSEPLKLDEFNITCGGVLLNL